MRSTYEWTAINRTLIIDVWKSQWLVILIPKVTHSLENLSIFVIEQIHKEGVNFQKVKESHWIRTLQLLVSEGLNLDL